MKAARIHSELRYLTVFFENYQKHHDAYSIIWRGVYRRIINNKTALHDSIVLLDKDHYYNFIQTQMLTMEAVL